MNRRSSGEEFLGQDISSPLKESLRMRGRFVKWRRLPATRFVYRTMNDLRNFAERLAASFGDSRPPNAW